MKKIHNTIMPFILLISLITAQDLCPPNFLNVFGGNEENIIPFSLVKSFKLSLHGIIYDLLHPIIWLWWINRFVHQSPK